jgi:hypothetical protein
MGISELKLSVGVVAGFFTKVLFAAHMFPGAGGANSPKQCFKDTINSIRWPSHITRLPKNVQESVLLYVPVSSSLLL